MSGAERGLRARAVGIAGTVGTDPAHQKNRAAADRATTKTALRIPSPYTIKNLDGAIAHLEVAITADAAMAIFGRRYWRERVQQIGSTPGILPPQTRRLQELLKRLSCMA